MDDLVERLITARDDDHERGCQMRFVVCSCGYDDQTARAVGDAKDRIEALQAEVARLRERLRAALPSVVWQSTVSADSDVRAITKRRANQIRAALKGTDNE